MRRTYSVLAASALVLVNLVGACGSGRDGFDPDVVASEDAGMGTFPDAAGSNPCLDCSADLRSVIDTCTGGTVTTTCPPSQACGAGACMDPCTAADLQKSTYGCRYWAVNLDHGADVFGGVQAGCFAAFISNTWGQAVHIDVERNGHRVPPEAYTRIPKGQGTELVLGPYNASAGLAPGEVAILFLAQGKGRLACPAGVVPFMDTDGAIATTGLSTAFQLHTDGPVIAYQVFPFGGGRTAATSATLLLPTGAWGRNHIAVNAHGGFQNIAPSDKPTLSIVAAEDATEVRVLPVVDIEEGGSIPNTPKGTPLVVTLSRGQYMQITQFAELTGSAIEANKPIGLFGGHTCLSFGSGACDTAQQQIPAVGLLGHSYVGVTHRGRHKNGVQYIEAGLFRFVGLADGTQLSYEVPAGDEPLIEHNAPKTLNRGQAVEFAARAFSVRSQDPQHPFYASAYMQGGAEWEGEGDPEWVNIVPVGQFLSRYVFFTDPSYPETNLIVVRRKGGAEVTLDCAGPIAGFQPVGDHEFARINLVTGNFVNVGACSNGRHEMTSAEPFGVTVWGWGSAATGGALGEATYSQFVSYAYPAGMSTKKLNDVVIPVPR